MMTGETVTLPRAELDQLHADLAMAQARAKVAEDSEARLRAIAEERSQEVGRLRQQLEQRKGVKRSKR